jgi:microcystin-dependent protein|tara:strand:- start:3067 stop:5172 length:2106 start_codon:yes stop_codon:yes gene_type:complete
MAYTIQYTDSAEKDPIVVEDQTINTDTSIKLPGRNSTGYGAAIAEDLLHLLENFASPTTPDRPVEGQLWYNNSTDQLLIYDGTVWVSASGLKKSTTEPDPGQAITGDLWVDTNNQQLYLFTGATWILVGPSFSSGLTTGAQPNTITGQDNNDYTVIEVQVNAVIVAIVAFNTFTPKATITGFSSGQIRPGINLANRDTDADGINNVKFYGTAEKAEGLIVNNLTIPAADFLRSDTESTTTFPLNVQNNTGIAYGINAELNIGIEGSAGVIQHNIEGSNIDFRVRNAGNSNTVLRVDSSLRVGINNEAPDEALDVTGNIKSSGIITTNNTSQSSTIGNGALVVKGGLGVAKTINVGDSINVQKSLTLGNTDLVVDTAASDLILPDLNNARNIGTPTKRWRKIYATTFLGNLEGQVSGNVSGKSGSADKLTSATTFRLTGDVETVENSFDGQTGGGVKTFALTLKNTVISAKEQVINSLSSDEFLIDRTTGASTGLKRVTRATLFNSITGLTPVGSIMPYAGIAEPSGWKFCNGQELAQGPFEALFTLVGFTYGPTPSSGYFQIPDLRGRFPLGNLTMGGPEPAVTDPDIRSRGSNSSVLGAVDGTDSATISLENLPEHEHDLKSSTGQQFYVHREVDGRSNLPDGVEGSTLQTGPDNLSQRLPSSGNVSIPLGSAFSEVGTPLETMNPFQTINYIIYTGVAG